MTINFAFSNSHAAFMTIPSASKTEVNEVKLPKLSLPSFNGQINEWLSYNNLFIVSIQNNGNLSLGQKIPYLTLLCKEDAIRVIRSTEDASYKYRGICCQKNSPTK